jgi:hypothetical protein
VGTRPASRGGYLSSGGGSHPSTAGSGSATISSHSSLSYLGFSGCFSSKMAKETGENLSNWGGLGPGHVDIFSIEQLFLHRLGV